MLTDIQQKIQSILDGNYNTKLKIKEQGEVFTPFELINEMLDKFQDDVWSNQNQTWLDPAAGIGNFHSVVLERLEANGIPKKHIIENQLYFIELDEQSAKHIKEIFDPNDEYDMNIACCDALKLDVEHMTPSDWKSDNWKRFIKTYEEHKLIEHDFF